MALSDLAAILANLDRHVTQIEAGATEGLTELGRTIARIASDAAPVETGALRDSWLGGPDGISEDGIIIGKTEKGNPYVEVGSNLPYASKIEYEDVAMLRPALHQVEAQVHTTIRAHVHTASRLSP